MRGSLTVETAVIMSTILILIAAIIKEAYCMSAYSISYINSHIEVQTLRHTENSEITKEWEEEMRSALLREAVTWQDKTFQGALHFKKFNPEEYMRKISIFYRGD